jgi:hypothetical protein
MRALVVCVFELGSVLLQDSGCEIMLVAAVAFQRILSSIHCVDSIQVGSSGSKQQADVEAVPGCSEAESGAILSSGVGIRSVVEKHGDDCSMAILRGPHQRIPAV